MPKLLYIVTEDWFFASHFLPMARAARNAGFDVAVATRVGDKAQSIAAAGCRVVPLDASRRGIGPIEVVRNLAQAYRIVRTEQPDIVHCIALKPVVLGGLAARWAGAPRLVLAPTGLGHLWTESGVLARAGRGIVRLVAGHWLRGPRTRYIFENGDDPIEFGLDPRAPEVTIVGGAGVDPADYPFTPEPPAPPVKVAVVSRMIAPKGIAEAVAAVQCARALGAPVELHLFGAPDESNRRAIPETILRQWSSGPGVTWHGRVTDIARVWREHHVAMLLTSYREGVPRALIEAAASGRPIVTTDTPGCRDIARDGGTLVAPGDIEAAAGALVRLAGDPALRARLGAAANATFRAGFTEEGVRRAVAELYRSMLAPRVLA